ncbi:transmembrane protein 138 [Coccinella septempunctata]|uniref:transmembrane protein 138 n=1 Tax=Coccinella septempunctata TaxID=41139 RepID=UPI001D0626D0|nr:transmembrane protein 138 [Coccinella septempunctata]
MVDYLTGRYVPIVVFQIILLVTDLLINIVSIILRSYNALILVFLIIQILCIILAFSTIFILFFSTYVYQVGLIELLHERFKHTIIVCLIYFLATLGINIWSLLLRYNETFTGNWPTEFIVFYILHRLFAPLYYYEFKRCFLRISDPRFYEDSR